MKFVTSKPAVQKVRIRVQQMEGKKATKTESIILYDTTVKAVVEWLKGQIDAQATPDK